MKSKNIYNSRKNKRTKKTRNLKKHSKRSCYRKHSSHKMHKHGYKMKKGGGTIKPSTGIIAQAVTLTQIPSVPVKEIELFIPNTESRAEPNYDEIISSACEQLFDRFGEYKEGLIYVSIGSSDFRDATSNSIEQMIPYFLLSNSTQRRTMSFCQSIPSVSGANCKILCIIIDFISDDLINHNKVLLNSRKENIDVAIINLHNLDSIVNRQNPKQRADVEKIKMLKSCCDMIGTFNQKYEINPMQFMCANYAKFRIPEELRNQTNILMTVFTSFEQKGYSESVYDWFGYIYNNDSHGAIKVKGLIYKTNRFISSIIGNPGRNIISGVAEKLSLLLNPSIFSRNIARNLDQLTPLGIEPVIKEQLDFVYPICEMSLPDDASSFYVDNYFTYNLKTFLKKPVPLTRTQVSSRQ